MSHQVPSHYADAPYAAQTMNYRQSSAAYRPSYRSASTSSHASSSRTAPSAAHLYARRAEVPPGRMSLNTSAQAGYQQQPAFEMHQAAFVVPSSSAATLELFGWGSPFGLDQATFGGMANHPIHVPATDAFQESDLVNAVPSISRLHRTATSEAGPSSNRREPAASEIECGQREAKKAVGASRKGRVAGARSRRAEKSSSSHQAKITTTGYEQPQLSATSRQAGQSTALFSSTSPMSNEDFAESREYAASLTALFEAPPKDEAAAQISCDERGFFVLTPAAEPEVNGDVDEPAPFDASSDQDEGSGSTEGSAPGLPAQDARTEVEGESATASRSGEADASPATGIDSQSHNNKLTEATGRKPRPKCARAVALEKLRRNPRTRAAIATDIATFKSNCRTSKRAAIAALPIYLDRYRPEVEAEMGNIPAAATTLTTRQRGDIEQPCILCGAPISGRPYIGSAKHRASCQVMVALVEEDCVVDYLDAKEVDLSWNALRQVVPKFGRPKTPGVVAVRQARDGGIWGDIRQAIAREVAAFRAKGVVAQPVAIGLTEEEEGEPGPSSVAGPSKRRQEDDDEDDAGPSSKRAYFGVPGGQALAYYEGAFDKE